MRRRRRTALRSRYGHLRKCPAGSVVQTLLFPRRVFNAGAAKTWASQHGFKATKTDITDRYIRVRQVDPKTLGRMRTISLGAGGVKAVVGWRHCR